MPPRPPKPTPTPNVTPSSRCARDEASTEQSLRPSLQRASRAQAVASVRGPLSSAPPPPQQPQQPPPPAAAPILLPCRIKDAAAAGERFIPSAGFAGTCVGYCFKMGALGLGYYSGEEPAQPAVEATAGEPQVRTPAPPLPASSRKRPMLLPEHPSRKQTASAVSPQRAASPPPAPLQSPRTSYRHVNCTPHGHVRADFCVGNHHEPCGAWSISGVRFFLFRSGKFQDGDPTRLYTQAELVDFLQQWHSHRVCRKCKGWHIQRSSWSEAPKSNSDVQGGCMFNVLSILSSACSSSRSIGCPCESGYDEKVERGALNN